MTHEALMILSDTISALGTILVYAEKDEISSELDSYAWLITGLGELSEQLTHESIEVSRALRQVNSQK